MQSRCGRLYEKNKYSFAFVFRLHSQNDDYNDVFFHLLHFFRFSYLTGTKIKYFYMFDDMTDNKKTILILYSILIGNHTEYRQFLSMYNMDIREKIS